MRPKPDIVRTIVCEVAHLDVRLIDSFIMVSKSCAYWIALNVSCLKWIQHANFPLVLSKSFSTLYPLHNVKKCVFGSH